MHIGFFDSGLGGLFVLSHVVKELPEYHYIFLGDTENVPYGTKSDEEIYSLTTASLRGLFERGCKLVIFACNTASVTALPRIQNEFLPEYFPDRKVLGVIIPTVEEALARGARSIALIATERTIHSRKYERELLARDSGIQIASLATPTLVPLIERGLLEKANEEAVKIIREELMPQHPDTLILGCTHYGLLKEALREAFPTLRILAQEEIVPGKLRAYLAHHPEIETGLIHDAKREFFLTKVTPHYEKSISSWLGNFPVSTFTPLS
ncbi:MAG: glutamate racemase [Candidatus Moraniibacteriota bacterium]